MLQIRKRVKGDSVNQQLIVQMRNVFIFIRREQRNPIAAVNVLIDLDRRRGTVREAGDESVSVQDFNDQAVIAPRAAENDGAAFRRKDRFSGSEFIIDAVMHRTAAQPEIGKDGSSARRSQLQVSGRTERVRLEFKNELSGAVVDRFGADAILVPEGDDRFTVTVSAAVNEPFFAWLCTFGDGARILAPDSAVNAMREHVEKILARYVPAKEGQS